VEDQKELYKLSLKFRDLAPWKCMTDSDLFGIQDPQTGQMGYCCVLGNARNEYGLVVYLGTEGLKAYLRIFRERFDPEDPDLMHVQKTLNLTFERRSCLPGEDLKLLDSLGFHLNESQLCPLIRSYLPGYFPWHLTGEQARYMSLALSQVMEVYPRFKANPRMFSPPEPGEFFARMSQREDSGVTWTDRWFTPPAEDRAALSAKPLDREEAGRIKQDIGAKKGTWEVHSFYSPVPVKDGTNRPFYGRIFLWMDSGADFILKTHLLHPSKEYENEFTRQFLEIIREVKSMPEKVFVTNGEFLALLEPVRLAFGIDVVLVKKFKRIGQARLKMKEYMSKGLEKQ